MIMHSFIRTIALMLVATVLAAPASADLIFLKNGRILNGKVTDVGKFLVIELAFGSIRIKKDQVDRVEKKTSDIDLYNAREAALKPKDADARHALALWCDAKDLPGRAKLNNRDALRINPNHEGARKALGYVWHDQKWMTYDEMMLATGHVVYEGRWITFNEKVNLDATQREERTVKHETELRGAELDRLRAEREVIDADRRRIEAERLRTLSERDAMRELQWRSQFGWPTSPWNPTIQRNRPSTRPTTRPVITPTRPAPRTTPRTSRPATAPAPTGPTTGATAPPAPPSKSPYAASGKSVKRSAHKAAPPPANLPAATETDKKNPPR
jgi:hypothetical protein